MDATEASQALTEIQQRRQQTLRRGGPRRVPAWFTYGSAAGLALASASYDASGWVRTVMSVAGAAVLLAMAALLERSTGVRLRMRALRWTPLALFLAAVLTANIGVGTLMRLLDVPADATIAGLAGALVWIVAMGPTQAAATAPRDPA
jgi:membrane associated rhomboid family serine protease